MGPKMVNSKLKKSSILLVEEDKDLNCFLSEVLKENYNVVSSSRTGDAALKLQNQQFHCVVIDLSSGGKTILNIIKDMQNLNHYKIQTVLVSSMLTKADIFNLKPYVTKFLVKPFDPNELILIINKLLSV